jgi:GNAT superfamily N-acetyltransferase
MICGPPHFQISYIWPSLKLRPLNANTIEYSEQRELALEGMVTLYRANAWSAAEKPQTLRNALRDSHALISAWAGNELVGLGNAISDGHLVVYYPHLLVHPDHQGRGIGTEILRRLMAKYQGFHQHILVADRRATEFYRKCGFTRAGNTQSMWIYEGDDH